MHHLEGPDLGLSTSEGKKEKIEEEENNPAPGGIRTHDLQIMMCALPLCYNHSHA